MALYLRILLILTFLTGIYGISTISKVSVKAGTSISIPCLYDSKYTNHVKYLCKGYYWSSCSYAIKTNQPSSGTFSISDDKKQRIFTVTIKDVTHTDYWCAVEINGGSDVRTYFHLSVVRDKPSLNVENQQIKAFKGGDVTVNCSHQNSGEMKWCKLGRNCVTGSSESIDGTRVFINPKSSRVFTVTMSGLKIESSGWYMCVRGDLQMPVHITVDEPPTTTTVLTTTHLTTVSPTQVTLLTKVADKRNDTFQDEQHNSSFDLKILIIPLCLLFFVMMTLFVWCMLKKHKQTKAAASSRTVAEEEVTYSTVHPKKRTSNQTLYTESDVDVMYSSVATVRPKRVRKDVSLDVVLNVEMQLITKTAEEEVTYSTVNPKKRTSNQTLYTESDVDVMYSSVATVRPKRVRKQVEANEENVTYSTLA